MADCSFGCLESSGSDLGGRGKDKSDITESSAYEIPELSQTLVVPEVSVSTACMDREPGYVNSVNICPCKALSMYWNKPCIGKISMVYLCKSK